MSSSHRVLKTLRQIHLYLGVFTAPMLMFFAITGGLQTFSLHETSRGSDYKPPAWLASAAQLHKKQTLVTRTRRAELTRQTPGAHPTEPTSTSIPTVTGEGRTQFVRNIGGKHRAERPAKTLLPMKLFFALVALSLLISTLTGLYMAYRYSRKPVVLSVVLAAGIAVPLFLLLL